MTKAFLKVILLVSIISFFSSCDKEYDSIGANIIGDNHFNTEKYDGASLSIINQKTGPIQTSNLDIYPFGIIENEVFGNTTANFATQVQLAAVAPTIDPALMQTIDSVVIHIPYYSKLVSTDTNGYHTYTLDSIVKGDYSAAKMKLTVYENNYFMRDRDPLSNFTEAQRFYSDQDATFNFLKNDQKLNNSGDLSQNDEFQFSSKELR